MSTQKPAPRAVIVSHDLWLTRLNGAADAIGRAIERALGAAHAEEREAASPRGERAEIVLRKARETVRVVDWRTALGAA